MKKIELKSYPKKSIKRMGRGISAGQGKTAGRGTKGQKSRSGFNIPKRFEGGQTPLSMRLPKLKGFTSVHKKLSVISLDQISKCFKSGEVVTPDTLKEKRLVKGNEVAKVLNTGTLSVKVTIENVACSKSALLKFEKEAPEKKEADKEAKPKVAKKNKS